MHLNGGERAENEEYEEEIVAEGTPIRPESGAEQGWDTPLPVGATAIQPTMPVTL